MCNLHWLSRNNTRQRYLAGVIDTTRNRVVEGDAPSKSTSSAKRRKASSEKPDNHTADFEPPIYNLWKQQEKYVGSSHFGNSEVRWLDNLLYLYTDPFAVVVDPFAGGGSAIDLR